MGKCRTDRWKRTAGICLAVLLFALPVGAENSRDGRGQGENRHLQVLATSDLHGRFLPYDYVLGQEAPAGSAAQLASAVRELRDEDTILVDAGDTIQGNGAEFFLGEEVHPMIQCLNAMGYDVWCIGNHELDYGVPVLKQVIAGAEPAVLAGNLYDAEEKPLSGGYVILERGGVKIGLIGMVTPACKNWDPVERQDYEVTDPLEETQKIIDEIQFDVDILIGVYHMGIEEEYDTADSGVRDIAMACPDFDVIIAAHNHRLVEERYINGVLIVENRSHGETMADITLTLEPEDDTWVVSGCSARTIYAKDYDPDPEIAELMARYDRRAKREMRELE